MGLVKHQVKAKVPCPAAFVWMCTEASGQAQVGLPVNISKVDSFSVSLKLDYPNGIGFTSLRREGFNCGFPSLFKQLRTEGGELSKEGVRERKKQLASSL